ncbi:MAG: acetate--CoA ligase [Gammaproteobacteria bacterium]|nr:acetate--CoA ligase [Gammaproteobacteria bacterium]
MSDDKVYPVPQTVADNTYISEEKYNAMYQQSIDDPDTFWGNTAKEFLDFSKDWDKVSDWSYGSQSDENVNIKWFTGAKLNVTYNCIDRHLAKRANQTAIIWEGDDPEVSKNITYQELSDEVNRFANVLKSRGVKKGDRVCIYMPMIPEAAYSMLACARIGAIHSVVFGGFSPEAVKDRILDSDCQIVITANEGLRGGKSVPLKKNVDQAVAQCPNVHTVLVIQNTQGEVAWNDNHDVWYHEAASSVDTVCEPEEMDAEDPLFILYTSGSTGKPKGVQHTTAGYLLYAAVTHKYTFDYKDGDIYWCTADVGWITGHSYIIYGPLANGATTLMFEGIPSYPDASRFWQVVDKHKVNTFYTAPTAIRALMAEGDAPVAKTDRSSLKLLGSVGEPINPEAWEWYYNVVGNKNCPIVDTWWQTETGGFMITPLPGATPLKPGSASRPFFGVKPNLMDPDGNIMEGEASGALVISGSWPGQMRTIYGDHKRFIETYFRTYPGHYFTSDGCRRDADGYYWITGRVDDVLNVSGHRLGTAEIESALVLHNDVAEAAIVGYPHDIKGQGIYAYITLVKGVESSDELKVELVKQVRKEIGPIATLDFIQWAPGLPKTRSGKIMRRILRKIASNDLDNMGDTSTLADPSVVETLIDNRENR